MSIENQFLKQAAKGFGDQALPESDRSQWDVADGNHLAEVSDVGTVLTQRGGMMAFIQFAVSSGPEEGKTPRGTMMLPLAEEAPMLVQQLQSGDKGQKALAGKRLTGVRMLADAYLRLTGDERQWTIAEILAGLADGSLKKAMVGKDCEIRVTHKPNPGGDPFLNATVRRGIGESPRTSTPVVEDLDFTAPSKKSTRPKTRTKPKPKRK